MKFSTLSRATTFCLDAAAHASQCICTPVQSKTTQIALLGQGAEFHVASLLMGFDDAGNIFG